MAWSSWNSPSGQFRNENHSPTVANNMNKLYRILIITLLFWSCNGKNNNELNSPENAVMDVLDYSEEDRIKELEYLKANIFYGLENLNNGFDSEEIFYFSVSDFELVLDRVEANGLGILGIEPWLDGDFYGVRVHEQINAKPNDPNWYRDAFSEFKKKQKDLMYAATYQIPEKLLKTGNLRPSNHG